MATVERVNHVLRKLETKQRTIRREERASCVVGYTQSYALRVHEMVDVPHRVGQAKYLEAPFRRHVKTLVRIVKTAWNAGRTLGQSLMLAGLRLQRESQLLVPVDTGALRASAFTRMERVP